jgi:hypothetical protein
MKQIMFFDIICVHRKKASIFRQSSWIFWLDAQYLWLGFKAIVNIAEKPEEKGSCFRIRRKRVVVTILEY